MDVFWILAVEPLFIKKTLKKSQVQKGLIQIHVVLDNFTFIFWLNTINLFWIVKKPIKTFHKPFIQHSLFTCHVWKCWNCPRPGSNFGKILLIMTNTFPPLLPTCSAMLTHSYVYIIQFVRVIKNRIRLFVCASFCLGCTDWHKYIRTACSAPKRVIKDGGNMRVFAHEITSWPLLLCIFLYSWRASDAQTTLVFVGIA